MTPTPLMPNASGPRIASTAGGAHITTTPEGAETVLDSTDPTVRQTHINRLHHDIELQQETIADADEGAAQARAEVEACRQRAATARAFIAEYQQTIDLLEGRTTTTPPAPSASVEERQHACGLALADLAIAGLPLVSWTVSREYPGLYGGVPHSGAKTAEDIASARAEVVEWARFLGVEVTQSESGSVTYIHARGVYEGADVDVWAALHLTGETEAEEASE